MTQKNSGLVIGPGRLNCWRGRRKAGRWRNALLAILLLPGPSDLWAQATAADGILSPLPLAPSPVRRRNKWRK